MLPTQPMQLRSLNTFGISAQAHQFAAFRDEATLQSLLKQFPTTPIRILGGGSNILLTQPEMTDVILKNEIQGISVEQNTDTHVILKVGGGENWHGFVAYCLAQNYGGVENLSLIPGTVGAAPLQNIGAYGSELKDVVVQVQGVHLYTGAVRTFTNAECAFGYRESIFKNDLKNQYCITYVWFRLSKPPHRIEVSYGAIREVLAAAHIEQPTIQQVSEAVIHIRRSKLPDPAQIGNAGSFFKNPELPMATFEALRQKYPTLPSYPVSATHIKVPAAWLIEQCGWKGKRLGAVGCHEKQPLVLVNYGEGTGDAVWALATAIQESVLVKFNIRLQPEVNIW